MSTVLDRLVAQKVVWTSGGDMPVDWIIPRYTEDIQAALEAASLFTRHGGNVRLVKLGNHVWEMSAWQSPRGRQHTESGAFASALCRAMLGAVGVSVKSSDG